MYVDQGEGEGFARGRPAGPKRRGQRRVAELARAIVHGDDRGAVDLDPVAVEDERGELAHGIAADPRRHGEIVVPPVGIDLLDQLDQQPLIAGLDVLQGHDVEPADDLHQAAGDLLLGQFGLIQRAEIGRGDADRPLGSRKRRRRAAGTGRSVAVVEGFEADLFQPPDAVVREEIPRADAQSDQEQ